MDDAILFVKSIVDEIIENIYDNIEIGLSKLSIHDICIPDDVIDGNLFTKTKRNELFGMIAGGAGSMNPEKYQYDIIVKGTKIKCSKTNVRINLRTNQLKEIACPNKHDDGYDYSENFDRVQFVNSKIVYINLKCIVGKGGSQTRSLREVYWFIQGQINTLSSGMYENVYYANILDGDEAHNSLPKFKYLLSLSVEIKKSNRIYIGDTKGYFDWFRKVANEE